MGVEVDLQESAAEPAPIGRQRPRAEPGRVAARSEVAGPGGPDRSEPVIRHLFHFDPKVTKAQARATGKLYSGQAKEGTLPHLAELLAGKRSDSFVADFAELGESFEVYSNRWLESPEREKLASWSDDESRLRVHIRPTLVTFNGQRVPLAKVPIRQVSPLNIKEFVFHIDQLARQGKMATKTGANIWSVVNALFGYPLRQPRLFSGDGAS
jgi:hypothetical protein